MRVYLIYIFCIGVFVYSWKDWLNGLFGLILVTAVVQNPDFPESFVNVQGLNLWNILFANVSLAWLVNRRRQGLIWDMPRHINVFLVLWLGVILTGWVWMVFDRSRLTGHTLTDLISEQLMNTIKWPLLGLLLYDGCRTRYRVKVALACIFLFFVLFAVQIVKYIPARAALEPGNIKVRMNLLDDVGISPNGAGKMMAGVPWAMLAIMPVLKRRIYKLFVLGLSVTSIFALALTGSRSGYIACGATLLLLCLIRWRRYLLLVPIAVLILPIVLPGATERMLEGFGKTDVTGEVYSDTYEITAGRTEIWGAVVPKIFESPIFGFGREAMIRTGMRQFLEDKFGKGEVDVSHPHNAYLEVLLESGLIGFVIIVVLHIFIWVYSIQLFTDRGDPLYASVGGFTLALLTGHLVAYMGGQSFYAEQIDVGLWCAIGIMLRLYIDRSCLIAQTNEQSSNFPYAYSQTTYC